MGVHQLTAAVPLVGIGSAGIRLIWSGGPATSTTAAHYRLVESAGFKAFILPRCENRVKHLVKCST